MEQRNMKINWESVILFVITLAIIVGALFFTLQTVAKSMNNYEKNCTRMSMNEFEDNCFCPCDKPSWIEKKLHLNDLCDGWIVKKNESCINTAI